MNFSPQQFASTFDDYLTRLTPFGFSGAALIAHHDEILVRKGYGLANRAEGIPNTPETVFCLGSITKQFTAAAIMKLAESGNLSPSDPISTHIGGVPEDKTGITIHHLLTHTAGLLNYTGEDYEPADHEHVLQKTLETPLQFEPGSAYDYSNAGYSLLAAIIEYVSKQPYEQFLHENLLKPVGLESTGYARPDWTGKPIARWYTGTTDHGHALEKHYPSWNIMGNGEMLSTLDDMFKWHQALATNTPLDQPAKTQMFTPFLHEYAYGWRVEESPIGKLVDHNGASNLGTSALFRRYLDAGLTLILFCNQSYGDLPMVLPLQDKIDGMVSGETFALPPKVDADSHQGLDSFVGAYALPSGGRVLIQVAGPLLSLAAEGQDAINVLAFPGEALDKHATLNEATRAAVSAAIEGNFEPLGEMLANREKRFANVSRYIRAEIEQGKDHFGEILGVEAAGSTPSTFMPDALDTTIAVRFERGTAAIISISMEGENVGIAILEFAQGWTMPCLPAGDRLIGYHIPLGRSVELGIERENDGQVTALKAGKIKLQKE